MEVSSDSDSDSDSDTSSSDTDEEPKPQPVLNVNERRTRRGVYAITKPQEEDSSDEEEDGEEDGENRPLADATSIHTDEADLDAGSDLTSLTPSIGPSDASSPGEGKTPDVMSPPNGKASRSSSLTELSSSSPAPGQRPTPLRNLLSRQQKARDESLTSTADAPSTDTASPKRVTRSVSSMLSDKIKGKGRGSLTPASTPGKSAVTKEDPKIKKEEVETRTLRARASVASVREVSKDPPTKPDLPCDQDGKPLPLCSTCKSILPIISVENQIVWGLDASSRKKHQKQECPRSVVLWLFFVAVVFTRVLGVYVTARSMVSLGLIAFHFREPSLLLPVKIHLLLKVGSPRKAFRCWIARSQLRQLSRRSVDGKSRKMKRRLHPNGTNPMLGRHRNLGY